MSLAGFRVFGFVGARGVIFFINGTLSLTGGLRTGPADVTYCECAAKNRRGSLHDEDVLLLWNAPSGCIIYQFTPDRTESEDTIYTASMNDTSRNSSKIRQLVYPIPLRLPWSNRIFSSTPPQQQRFSR